MALPTSKQELADWILRRLGAPVINIEIADVQLEDVIDEAVQFYQEYHFDGVERTYRVIKLTEDMLNGNYRRQQDLTAPMFDALLWDSYRVGDRVMTYKTNGMPDRIWVKFDSEETVNFRTYYVEEPNGPYFAFYSVDDLRFIFDSEAIDHIDSDAGFVLYDSDLHNEFVYTQLTVPNYSIAQFVDSDGSYVLFDSDTHSTVFYDSDAAGVYVDSDGTIVVYDSDTHVGSQRFTKRTELPDLFSRASARLGSRYNRIDSEEIRKQYTWEELWKEEDLVMTEPVLDLDYSQTGQVGIPIPDSIIGVSKVFRVDNFSGMGMWNYEYQYFLNNFDFFYGNGASSQMPLTNYYITKSYIDMIDHMMNVQPAIRFNKARNRLYLDTNWKRLSNTANGGKKEYYLMAEVYEINDPEVYGDVYKNSWLKRYATALAKMQWGSNLKRYSNVELPGGVTMDGQTLYDEGKEEATTLEEELRNNQLETDFFIG